MQTRREPTQNAVRWYVAETAPRKEQLAVAHLERQAFRSFCPRFRKTRRHARRLDEILAPVFPGYVFVRFDRDRDPWLSINGTFGIKQLVGPRPSQPQPVPECVMGVLLARCVNGVVSSVAPELQPGQTVRLLAGPFADQIATVERLDERDRVFVLLKFLGGATPATVRISDLAPA